MWTLTAISLGLSTTALALALFLRLTSPSSSPASPPPSGSPTPSVSEILSAMTTMTTTMMGQMASDRQAFMDMTKTMVLGPERLSPSTPPTSESRPHGTWIANEGVWDYDRTPLPDGIEAVFRREAQETELQTLMTERDALQQRLQDLQRQEAEAQISIEHSEGPWRREATDAPPPPAPGSGLR